MKTKCCNKIIRTPFCPHCGKEAGSPKSLLSYLEVELEQAIRKQRDIKCRLNKKSNFYRENNRLRNEGELKTVKIKIGRLEDWINWVVIALKRKEADSLE